MTFEQVSAALLLIEQRGQQVISLRVRPEDLGALQVETRLWDENTDPNLGYVGVVWGIPVQLDPMIPTGCIGVCAMGVDANGLEHTPQGHWVDLSPKPHLYIKPHPTTSWVHLTRGFLDE